MNSRTIAAYMQPKPQGGGWDFYRTLVTTLLGLSVTAGVWVVTSIHTMDTRLVKLETSSLSKQDAEKLRDSINEISVSIAKLPTEPKAPQWLIEELRGIKEQMRQIWDKVNDSNRLGQGKQVR